MRPHRALEVRPDPVPATIYSFSSENDLPEQVAAISSFFQFAGVPPAFTVVSDGTHVDRSRALLRALHPCVDVIDLDDLITPDLPQVIHRFARSPIWQLRKLAFQVALPVLGTTMYFDSDVLFFPGARHLAETEYSDSAPSFLEDCLPWDAPRYGGMGMADNLLSAAEKRHPVNGGAYVLRQRLDWDESLTRFGRAGEPLSHYIDQILLHVAMHAAGARPLPRERFVMENDDELSHRDSYAGPDIVLRHYFSTVRYKFWCEMARRSDIPERIRITWHERNRGEC